jgi:hypothetical protein
MRHKALFVAASLMVLPNPAYALECNIPWSAKFGPPIDHLPASALGRTLVDLPNDRMIVITLHGKPTDCSVLSNCYYVELGYFVTTSGEQRTTSFKVQDTFVVYGHQFSIGIIAESGQLTHLPDISTPEAATVSGCLGIAHPNE